MVFIWYSLFAVCLPFVASSSADCSQDSFPCDSGNQCVGKNEWCDGGTDCSDQSDEAYCKKVGWFSGADPNNCLEKDETHILCDSGICLPIAAKCDKHKDCDDGFDEKYCGLVTTTLEYTSEVSLRNEEENFVKEDETTVSTAFVYETSPLVSIAAKHNKEDGASFYEKRMKEADVVKEDETTVSTAFVYETSPLVSTGAKHNKEDVTSFYEKRMKEADSEKKLNSPPPATFPKTAPTRAYVATPKAYPRSFTRPTSTTTLRNVTGKRPPDSVIIPRSQITQSPRYIGHLPPINPYQIPTNHYQPPTNHHQTPSNRYQPPSNRYQPSTNYNQPPDYQPRQPPYTNYNEHRPLNGEPDVRYQANYFKPYGTELGLKKPFYFAKDYATLYRRDNERSIREGVEWLLRQRSDKGDWGRDTPRAVVALALANNSFLNGDNDDEIIKRKFMIQLGADLLRNNTKNFNINRLSMAINALLAVCEDPTDFHGTDLTEMLRHKMRDERRSYLNPFLFLSLCLSNKSLSSSEIQSFVKLMTPSVNANERAKDMQRAALMAFSCHVHQSTSENSNHWTSFRSSAVANLLEQIGEEGNFGSVYSTALAAQVLMSTNESSDWNAAKTMNFLRKQQREDGSFGDLLATYWVLPALSGRSLMHLRNIHCSTAKKELTPQEIIEFAGPKQYVRYSLFFGYPLVNSQSLYLLVPRGIHFLDVMRLAEYQDQNFRFARENNVVYSLSGLPNDPEMGLSWHLYVKEESSPYSTYKPNSREKYTGDVSRLSPKSDEHLIYWYHSNDLRL